MKLMRDVTGLEILDWMMDKCHRSGCDGQKITLNFLYRVTANKLFGPSIRKNSEEKQVWINRTQPAHDRHICFVARQMKKVWIPKTGEQTEWCL